MDKREDLKVRQKLADDVIKYLDERISEGQFNSYNLKFQGIRSRQVVGLIMLLTEMGVIKMNHLEFAKEFKPKEKKSESKILE